MFSWCLSINGIFAQSLRHAQKIMLGISVICLCLFFSHSLTLNENPHFWTDTSWACHRAHSSESRRIAYLFLCFYLAIYMHCLDFLRVYFGLQISNWYFSYSIVMRKMCRFVVFLKFYYFNLLHEVCFLGDSEVSREVGNLTSEQQA